MHKRPLCEPVRHDACDRLRVAAHARGWIVECPAVWSGCEPTESAVTACLDAMVVDGQEALDGQACGAVFAQCAEGGPDACDVIQSHAHRWGVRMRCPASWIGCRAAKRGDVERCAAEAANWVDVAGLRDDEGVRQLACAPVRAACGESEMADDACSAWEGEAWQLAREGQLCPESWSGCYAASPSAAQACARAHMTEAGADEARAACVAVAGACEVRVW